jgi:hypothetical protein
MSAASVVAADILADVGRAIFLGEEWQARLAAALSDAIQHGQSGRLPFGPGHGAFDDLALVAQRESERRLAPNPTSRRDHSDLLFFPQSV